MAGGGGGGRSRQLDETPTWALASVCAVIIVISIALEKVLHHIGEVRNGPVGHDLLGACTFALGVAFSSSSRPAVFFFVVQFDGRRLRF